MIKFENVSKKYKDGTMAVDRFHLEIKEGEFFVLIGPSGCGKTTTLKMINRLIPLTNGTISIDGKRISDYKLEKLRWNIGYVLQQIALFPHMTVEENIAIVPELKKWEPRKIKDRVTELLDMVGLDPDTYRNRKPSELSGGEQQRIGVIRALAADPDIILMDEPFSALDPISREKLQDDIIDLQKRIQKTIVFVTHDMQEAVKLADRICIMKQGKRIQVGTPEEIMRHPADEFVRDFVGMPKKQFEMKLEEVVEPIGNETPETVISSSASLEEVMEQLAVHKQLGVKKNDQVIGWIDQQMMISYLAAQLKEGAANG